MRQRRQASARGLIPQCRLAPPHRETYWSRIRSWIVRNFQILIFTRSKSVNNVCKLFQLVLPIRGFVHWPHYGISVPRPPGLSLQIKIHGAALGSDCEWKNDHVRQAMCAILAWHGISGTHMIVIPCLPHTRMLHARATGEAIPRTLHYTTWHPLTDIDSPAAASKQAVNVTDNVTTGQSDFPILYNRFLSTDPQNCFYWNQFQLKM